MKSTGGEWTGIDGNCPIWPHASAVYSKCYRYMDEHGSDNALIEALDSGNENDIKARMLGLNAIVLIERGDL